MDYAIVVVPLSDEDGGGFVGVVPDLPGCKGDGETREEAVADAQAAVLEWMDEAERLQREVPPPGAVAKRWREERDALRRAIEVLALDNLSLESRNAALTDLLRQITEEFDERDSRQGSLAFVGGSAVASVTVRRSSH